MKQWKVKNIQTMQLNAMHSDDYTLLASSYLLANAERREDSAVPEEGRREKDDGDEDEDEEEEIHKKPFDFAI